MKARDAIGKTVFRMFACGGKTPVAIYEARVVSVAGSWVTLENKNGRWKENGLEWSENVRDAIDKFILDTCIHLRYCHGPFKGIAEERAGNERQDRRVELIRAAAQEAIEWGLTCGRTIGFVEATKARIVK